MNNHEIADHFSLLAQLMDIHGENSFKSKSYNTTAYTIEKLPEQISEMDDATLFSIRGIGSTTGEKIKELLTTGKFTALEKLLAITPPGILEMLHIKRLGPKKIAVLWKELEIETIGELEYACNENRLVSLKGFGNKTQENILQNVSYYKQSEGFHLWAHADRVATSLMQQLQAAYPENLFSLTGDLRRQNEIVAFVEVVTDAAADQLTAQFQTIPDTTIATEPDNVLIVQVPNQPRIKFHITPTASFYHTLFMTTGSSDFLAAFLSSYKVPETPASEQDIFTAHDLAYISPALRETAGVLHSAQNNTLPDLISPESVKGVIHSHSTWSDGTHTIEQMAKAARDKGYEYLVISDHSQAAFYANGLTPERIAAQHQEVDVLNAKLAPFKIFKSIEADILSDGRLDYNDNVLNTFDLVIASVHSNLKMSLEKAMSRVLTAVRNPYTTILGHATGRLLLSRKGYPLDHKEVIDVCAEHNVVVEINANPRRLDIDWRWVEYAIEKGVLLSIDPDAHSVNGYNDIYYGTMVAQKGGLTASGNLSSFSLQQFEAFLEQQHAKRLTKQ